MRTLTLTCAAVIAAAGIALAGTPAAHAISDDNTEVATVLNNALRKGDISLAGLGTAQWQTAQLKNETDDIRMETCLVEAIHMTGGTPSRIFLRQQFQASLSGLDRTVENEVFVYNTPAEATASFTQLITRASMCEEDLILGDGRHRIVTHGRTLAKIAGVQGVWFHTTDEGAPSSDAMYRAYMLSGRSISMVGYWADGASYPITVTQQSKVNGVSKKVAKRLSSILG